MASTLTPPQVIAQPFATGGDKATIPEISGAAGVASLNEGLPPECSLPIASGGAYTRRTDINGLGYLATSLNFFLQNGGVFEFDSNVATAIGGYPTGARLNTTIGGRTVLVRSLVDNNSLDPATNLDGVNWAVDVYTDTEYVALTGGTVNLTQTAIGTYTYNLSGFTSLATIDTNEIRTIHIKCDMRDSGITDAVFATYPDGTEIEISAIDGGPAGKTSVNIVDLPVKNSQSSSFDIRISGDGSFAIFGATQRTY